MSNYRDSIFFDAGTIAEYDAEGAAIIQKYRRGDITQTEAFQELLDRKDPFAASSSVEDYFQ